MKIWVVGSQGMVGSLLLKEAKRRKIEVVGSSHQECDITNEDQLSSFMEKMRPTHVVNCVAITNVDLAEEMPQKAYQINCEGAALLAKEVHKKKARYLHISTDYVFGQDEERSIPYQESDPPAPVNVYGMSKWKGEEKVLSSCPHACIVRTSWVFGGKGNNLLATLLQKFCEQEEISVVSDQIGAPTYAPDLVQALLSLLDQEGIIHFSNEGGVSRYEAACLLLEEARRQSSRVICKKIVPITRALAPTKAKRPRYTVLDTTLYTKRTGKKIRLFVDAAKEWMGYAFSF